MKIRLHLRNAVLALSMLFVLEGAVGQGAQGAIVAKIRPNSASPATTPKTGDVTLNISLPLDKIAQFANQFEFRFSSRGVAANLLSYEGTLTVGQVAVAASGDSQFPIRLTAPFRLDGKLAGFPIDQTGDATIDFAIEFGSSWCPAVKFNEPSVTLKNKERLPEKISKSIPSLGDFIAAKFLSSELQNKLGCDAIRSEIAKAWGSVVIPLPVGGKTFFLSVDPQSIGLSDFALSQDRVSFTATLTGITSLNTKAVRPKTKPLPELKVIAPMAAKDPTTELEGILSAPINLSFTK